MTGLQGRTFGGYQLLAPIGAGGVAEAYRAMPLQGSGREVVVKVIHPTFAQQPAFQARFQQAVQKSALLANHAHVLPVLASGEDNGYFYLVTPYVTDGTLRDWIARGWRLGPPDVGPFFRQLSNGLAYAHSRGVVHENLKPNNIFLFEGRHVLLADFGMLWDIAQIDPQFSGPASEAVEFLAPEAFNKVVSPAADMYSLGAVLFTTLTGRAPFRGPTPGAVYAAHMNQPVPPLAAVEPGLHRQLQALDAVIQRAMAKRPEERYPTPMLFADAVDSTLLQAQKATPGKSQRPSVWSLGTENPLTFNEFGMPVLANQTPIASQMGGALDGLMEDGHIAANWNDASVQHTLRVPSPAGPPIPPSPPMPPTQNYAQDYAQNYAQGYGQEFAPAYGQGYAPGYEQGYAPGGVAVGAPPTPFPAPLTVPPPAGPPEIQAPPYQPIAQPAPVFPGLAPAPGSAPLPDEASSGDRGYSATDLGLPRLTYADLGKGLAGDVAQQLEEQTHGATDERLSTGSETGAHSGALDFDESSTYTATHGGARIQYRGETSESAAWPAARPPSSAEWGYSEEQSAYYSTTAQPRRGASRTADRWDAMESVERPAGGGRRSRASDRDERDIGGRPRYDRYENKQAYDRSPTRRPRSEPRDRGRWLRPLVFGVLPTLALGLILLVIAKPGICPNGACDSFSSAVRKAVPALNQFGGAPAPSVSLTASPVSLQMTTQAGVEKGATFSLISAGADKVPWQATASLPWLSISPASGMLTGGSATPITVTARPTGINPGQYTGAATITAGGSSLRVPVTITVAIGPQLTVTPTALSFTTCGSQQAIMVKNTGDAALTVTAALAANSATTLTLSATSLALDPNASDTVKVSVKCSAPVNPNYGVLISSNGGSAQVTVKYS
jgi:serine/threonine protein kinase